MDDNDQSAWTVRTAARIAEEIISREGELPARSDAVDELVARLGIELGSEGLPLDRVADKLRKVLLETPSAASPRFLNQLFGGRDLAATLAEMLVPLTNTSMYTYKVAAAQVLVEREVLDRMLAAVPFPNGEGMFSPGGSLANLTAMLLARNEAFPDSRDHGIGNHRPAVYTSADSHYSVRKAAGILGLGREAVRVVPTDRGGAMRPAKLDSMIADDIRDGLEPVFVNATAGTTVLGAVDPLEEISRITRARSVWLHVDGALGAPLLLATKYRDLLSGVEQADSVAWNAHKMMAVPLPCSVLLLRRRGLLRRHLDEHAGYLFQADEAELNPGTRSIQCGRRNDALKLWAAWQYHGDSGFDQRLTRLLDLARSAADLVERDPELELVARPMTVNVCFRVRGYDSASICDFLDRSSILKIGYGSVSGTTAIRLVCVDPRLDLDRIEHLVQEIKTAAHALGAESD